MRPWMFACLAAALTAAVSCDENPIDQLDQESDCAAICDRYKDCFDKNYDTDKCADRCETRTDDPDHKNQEEKCSDCIDDASCGGAAFGCATQCLGIVP